ncbi:MAG: hypothetical protein U9N61_07770 [Euryarchaeota archaeon]|nr:hypothetical protein [Euryarchaeota archaeon]
MNLEKRKEELQIGIQNHQREIAQLQKRIQALVTVIEQKRGAVILINQIEEDEIESEDVEEK